MGESTTRVSKPRVPNIRLKQAREQHFWTLEDVANRISDLPEFGPGEPDPYTVGRWERGVSAPSPRYCRALCTIFAMDPQMLGLLPASSVEKRQGLPIVEPLPDVSTDLASALERLQVTAIPTTSPVAPSEQAMQHATIASSLQQQVISEPEKVPSPSLFSLQEGKNRQRLLKRVYSFWIQDVLEHSLHQQALIAQSLQTQSEAIANPWRLVLQEAIHVERTLPAGTSITQVYEEADGMLLILGDPGAGKTTLLLELARHLLIQAEQDENQPMPVIFTLSSWAVQRQPLTEWLIQELRDKYQVPLSLGRNWVEQEQLLLLLDGLDEVPQIYQEICIEAINAYRQEHGLVSMVVCSRRTDYLLLSTRLLLRSAVAVQPLTAAQVDAYLANAGDTLSDVHKAFQRDPVLRELITTPLWLHVLMLAYQGKTLTELPEQMTVQQHQSQLFDAYVKRMLERRGLSQQATKPQMRRWLTWLAKQMQHLNQTIFYLEQMQPALLETELQQRWYERSAIHFPAMLMGVLVSLIVNISILGSSTLADSLWIAIVGGVIGGALSVPCWSARLPQSRGSKLSWRQSLVLATAVGLGSCVVFGALRYIYSYKTDDWISYGLRMGLTLSLGSFLLILLLGRQKYDASKTDLERISSQRGLRLALTSRSMRKSLPAGLIVGGLLILTNCLHYGPGLGLSRSLMIVPAFVLIYGIIEMLMSMILYTRESVIAPTEIVVLSWRRFTHLLFNRWHLQRTLIVGGCAGLSGLIFGLLNRTDLRIPIGPEYVMDHWLASLLKNMFSYGLATGLSLAIGYWILVGLFQGIASGNLEDTRRMVPNEGIHRSAYNGLVVGIVCGCVGYLISIFCDVVSYGVNFQLRGINGGIHSGLIAGIHDGLAIGLAGGLLMGLLNGGIACWQHSILRLFLWLGGKIPRTYVRFLEDATQRLLLYKAGGGYLFIHRLLQRYLADKAE